MKRALLLLCTVSALAAGTAPAQSQDAIVASPSRVSFGSVAIGQTKTVDVVASCEVACSPWLMSVDGDIPAGSGLSFEWGQPGECLTEAQVAAGEQVTDPHSCTFRVLMTGQVKGHYKATFQLVWGCCRSFPPTEITLSGTTRR
jgi:hypothetical protein